jgi:REP element-mobilizing transposase RayT
LAVAPQPIYSPATLSSPAYQLRYTWSGWPSSGTFPSPLSDAAFQSLDEAWEQDGLRRLEQQWCAAAIQFTFSVKPNVSPVFFASRVKGRLQHALRSAGTPIEFSRKLAVRTIGDNTTQDVERYVRGQVEKESFDDARYAEFLREFTVVDPDVDLGQPTTSNSGRYWYNLHLVLLVADGCRFHDRENLVAIRDWSLAIGRKKGYAISTLSIMPDHIHAALRGNVENSPEEIALAFMNNLAYALGQSEIWRPSYYAGTFGEYDMGAVRR